ncbi:sulfate ABC transporter permease subunit CysW [Nostoc sp. 'Peltigera membranacea cyanobiont' 213]|uniref:sulfate ABC transporter permease subunit CysW n=1 Tax=unclassified Nostoc TaxID=2593658 RepID=UPI000B959EEB|nr:MULTISPECIES: sulfate ABC transporter permease subunit CysW [unclassified Nostoc]AVH63906.1 sulfate ABC transporter permease [Nostoc sp. 'Peltigera membranacea cyanobiont' N6]AVH66304.1 sulfate ABC transporter permease CysW [Nostoc sp. 'Peltigera membranacea cyanobiont' N6]OYD89113.1 sulfate ABC transporter permease subunit CysW [Nostoc sp. 'Peltigera membranacea cyanobiont' 213]
MKLKLQPIPWGRYVLMTLGLSFLAIAVLFPLLNIFYQAFASGIEAYLESVTMPEARHAIFLTVLIALICVPVNTVFGILAAWVLARYSFPGKVMLLLILDLPLAISPTIVGLMFILLYSPTVGLFSSWLQAVNIRVIFALPGMILTTLFVTIPFVVREVLPVLQSMGLEEEEVAQTLGANSWQIFWRVTFPTIRWGLFYGVILCTSRAIGEFGAVSVVSGKLINETNTLTLHIEQVYAEYQTVAAFACASLLAILALLTLVAQEFLRNLDVSRTVDAAKSSERRKSAL